MKLKVLRTIKIEKEPNGIYRQGQFGHKNPRLSHC